MSDNGALAGAFVGHKIKELARQNDSSTKATLAKLRRGIGRVPGSVPELWQATMEGLPEALCGTGDPTIGEWAVHTSLTLFALHQQGKDIKSQCMSREGTSLGMAVRGLVKNDDDMARVKRRFDAAATADSPTEFAHHLRGLVQLLKSEDIPLDYAALTRDLYWFQIPQARDRVRLNWGRDFYRIRKDDVTNDELA